MIRLLLYYDSITSGKAAPRNLRESRIDKANRGEQYAIKKHNNVNGITLAKGIASWFLCY